MSGRHSEFDYLGFALIVGDGDHHLAVGKQRAGRVISYQSVGAVMYLAACAQGQDQSVLPILYRSGRPAKPRIFRFNPYIFDGKKSIVHPKLPAGLDDRSISERIENRCRLLPPSREEGDVVGSLVRALQVQQVLILSPFVPDVSPVHRGSRCILRKRDIVLDVDPELTDCRKPVPLEFTRWRQFVTGRIIEKGIEISGFFGGVDSL